MATPLVQAAGTDRLDAAVAGGGEFRRHWRVLSATVLMSCCTWLPASTFGLFIDPLGREFGRSNAQIGAWVTVFFLGVTVTAPFAGAIADRLGARPIVIVSLPLFALSIAALASVGSSFWALYALAGCAGVAGASVINGTGPSIRAVTRWFDQNRAMALSMVAAGASLASFIGPSVIEGIIDAYGWRVAFLSLGLACLVPLPFVIGWLKEPQPTGRAAGRVDAGVGACIRRPLFWALTVASAAYCCGIYGLIVFLAPLLNAKGVDHVTAAAYVGFFGVASVSGKLLSGYMCDRIHALTVGAVALFIQAFALIAMTFDTSTHPLWLCLPVGFTYGVQTATVPYSVSRYFSLATFSQLIGILTLVAGLGSSLGPYVFGLLRDLSGTYTWSLLGSAAAALVAGTLFAMIAKHPYQQTD